MPLRHEFVTETVTLIMQKEEMKLFILIFIVFKIDFKVIKYDYTFKIIHMYKCARN